MNLVMNYNRRFVAGLQVGHAVLVVEAPDKESRVWPKPEKIIKAGGSYEIAKIITCMANLGCRKTCTTGCKAFMLKAINSNGEPVVHNSCHHILATIDGQQIRF